MTSPIFRKDRHYMLFITFLELNFLDILTTYLYFWLNTNALELSPLYVIFFDGNILAFLAIKAVIMPIIFVVMIKNPIALFRRTMVIVIFFAYIFAILANLSNIILFIK